MKKFLILALSITTTLCLSGCLEQAKPGAKCDVIGAQYHTDDGKDLLCGYNKQHKLVWRES